MEAASKAKHGRHKQDLSLVIKKLRKIEGGRSLINAQGEIEISLDDIKQGKKLDILDKFNLDDNQVTKAEVFMNAKKAYYKNIKPKTGVFVVAHISEKERLKQELFEKNKV